MKDLVELPGKGLANFDKQSDFGNSVSKYKNCKSDYGMYVIKKDDDIGWDDTPDSAAYE